MEGAVSGRLPSNFGFPAIAYLPRLEVVLVTGPMVSGQLRSSSWLDMVLSMPIEFLWDWHWQWLA